MDFNGVFSTKRGQNAVIIIIFVLSLFLVFKIIGEVKGWKESSLLNQNIITVTGTGEAFAVPDVAMITFTVNETASSAEEANKNATKKNNDALKYLKDNGILSKDVQTQSYNINPQYDYNSTVCVRYPCPPSVPKIVGYEVTQSTVVKVRNTDKAGEILDGIIKLGITSISGPSLSIDDEDIIKNEARAKAIADAKSKAEELAKELGVKLGRITSFSESSGGYPMPMYAAMDSKMGGIGGGGPAPEIATGENKVTANVTISYSLR